MTKAKKLVIIIPTAIVTIFLLVCITVGVLRWKHHSAHWTQPMGWSPPSPFFVVCYESYDFVQDLYAATKYYCWPYPASDNWIECRKVKYVQRYLRNEKVKKIAFGITDFEKGEIVEPEKIKQVLQLISTAQEEINFPSIPPWDDKIIITTDKHKFVIPVRKEDKAIHGLDWTSKELYKKLWEWGYGYKYKYNLPPKEQVVAILLYPHHYETAHPLAFFGDEKLMKEIMFGVWIVPEKIFDGREWLEKIVDAYSAALKEATERKRYFPEEVDNPVGRIVFVTKDVSPGKDISIDANTVYDDYIKSEQLKQYFDELGLTKELLAEEPNVRRKASQGE